MAESVHAAAAELLEPICAVPVADVQPLHWLVVLLLPPAVVTFENTLLVPELEPPCSEEFTLLASVPLVNCAQLLATIVRALLGER